MPERHRDRILLLLSPTAAVALSFWVMSITSAPSAAFALQAAALVVSGALGVVLARRRPAPTRGATQWWALAAVATLAIPLLFSSNDGPARWMSLGGARVYVAAVVLPPLLALLRRNAAPAAWHHAILIAAALVLVLQPDAAQATAFCVGALTLLPRLPGSTLVRLATGCVLVLSAIITWAQPDPLVPVPYVEGVFVVALAASPWMFAVALCAAIAPVAALLSVARTGEPAAGAVAAYYTTILLLAPLQVTPVPLLGFGAGPVLGYGLAAGLLSQRTS
ncbi:MAG: hypothetical protein AB7L71_10335 [Vicinamibacterales bacterium]